MDLRTQTSLEAGVLSLAIAATVLLRTKRRRVDWFFALFGSTVAMWYISTFLTRFLEGGFLLERFNRLWAILLPVSAVHFFRTFLQPESKRATLLSRVTLVFAALMTIGVFTPLFQSGAFAALIFAYVVILLSASLMMLYGAGRSASSRFDRARLNYLAIVGTMAALFLLAEYLPYAGPDIPPVGTVLVLVFLYILSQSIVRFRIIDLYELAGRLTFLTALSFSLAGAIWLLVRLAPGLFFLHSVVAALVLFLMFDPIRTNLEKRIAQLFMLERHQLEKTIERTGSKLAHTLSIKAMTGLVVDGLNESRRVTNAAIYLIDESQSSFVLSRHLGPEPIPQIETAPARPLLDRVRKDGAVIIENLERELEEAQELQEEHKVESLADIIQLLDSMHASICVALRGSEDFYGLLCLRDDRLRDAFSPEEVRLIRSLGAQASIAIENSFLYQRLRLRDRLAALGEMSAGLAHEIRNPLGAIKASAQFLNEPSADPEQSEFLQIIVDEVNRLDRVVSSFLDYARPSKGDASPSDINAVVKKTLALLEKDFTARIEFAMDLHDELPSVRIDPEQLRQVLINLCQNAIQAMEGEGTLHIATRTQARGVAPAGQWVELIVRDTGPGIPDNVLANLFVPFVTTKERGTGLGLAISQRIIDAANGHIDIRSEQGKGATFIVRLPPAHIDEAPSLSASRSDAWR